MPTGAVSNPGDADETFDPVVAVSTFSSENEAVERANASDFGLNFSIWTRDVKRGRHLASRLEAGIVTSTTLYRGGRAGRSELFTKAISLGLRLLRAIPGWR